jgi:hypothetical protein
VNLSTKQKTHLAQGETAASRIDLENERADLYMAEVDDYLGDNPNERMLELAERAHQLAAKSGMTFRQALHQHPWYRPSEEFEEWILQDKRHADQAIKVTSLFGVLVLTLVACLFYSAWALIPGIILGLMIVGPFNEA